MNPPRRLRGAFGMCNSKTRSAKASRSPLEGFAKAPRAPPFGNDSSDNDKPPEKMSKGLVRWEHSLLAVETKPLHGIKRVPQCNHIGSTV